jgi:hypothetical protein
VKEADSFQIHTPVAGRHPHEKLPPESVLYSFLGNTPRIKTKRKWLHQRMIFRRTQSHPWSAIAITLIVFRVCSENPLQDSTRQHKQPKRSKQHQFEAAK